jgi:hypothetical protein
MKNVMIQAGWGGDPKTRRAVREGGPAGSRDIGTGKYRTDGAGGTGARLAAPAPRPVPGLFFRRRSLFRGEHDPVAPGLLGHIEGLIGPA